MTIISIPYYALKFSVLYFLFYFAFIVLSCIAGLNQLHRARLRKNQEARQLWVFSSLFLNLVEIFYGFLSLHAAMYGAHCEKSSQSLPLQRTSKGRLEDFKLEDFKATNIDIKFCFISIWKKMYVDKRVIHYNCRKSIHIFLNSVKKNAL